MTPADLARAIALTGADPDSATMRACRRALVDGLSAYAAAREQGIGHPGVYRGAAKLRAALARPTCPTCGRPAMEG